MRMASSFWKPGFRDVPSRNIVTCRRIFWPLLHVSRLPPGLWATRLLWQQRQTARRRRERRGTPLPCWQAQPFPDVLDDPFDQARQVRSGFNRFDPSSLVMGGSPGFPGSRGLLPTCALLCFDEFVANQGGVQHAMLPFVLEVVGSNPVLLRMVPLDHPARVSSLRPVCLEQGRQTTANP